MVALAIIIFYLR